MRKIFNNYSEIKIYSIDKSKLFTFFLEQGITYSSVDVMSEYILLHVSIFDAKRVNDTLNKNGFKAEILKKHGFLSEIGLISKRPGIIIGIFFMLFFTIISSKFVWKIEIDGNKSVGEEEILAALEKEGFEIGTYIPNIDYDKLHNRVLTNLDKISWISVNVDGNIAKILVEETKKENNQVIIEYSNIVSNEDAQISSIIVKNGELVVTNGMVVKKGELLVSGVIESHALGLRYVDANAKILGYVNKKIEVKIPFKSTTKEYTGVELIRKEYKLFNNISFFSINYGNLPSKYDTIITSEFESFFGINNLPLEVITTKYLEYHEKENIYSLETARDLAFSELKNQLDVSLKNAELVSKDIKTSYDDEFFYITCDIYFIKDICEKNLFRVNSN